MVKGKINWLEQLIEPNLLYHTNSAESVDAFVLQGKELLLIQITTANPPNPEKYNNLLEEIKKASNNAVRSGKYQKVRGWFVSLFDFKENPTIRKEIYMTVNDELIPILGKEFLDRLREVKKSF